MSFVYFDTSALLKRYVTEIGSGWVRSYMAASPTPAVFTSVLTAVEATCAFARRLREGTLQAGDHAKALQAFDYDITYRYTVLDVMPAIIETARRLATHHPLRAYDAVQLATAWLLDQDLRADDNPPLIFVCADGDLIAVAQAEGLLVDNPNHHP